MESVILFLLETSLLLGIHKEGAVREEFARRYREYLPRILNFMRLRVGDEALAQDLTAATFEQALTHLHQLRSPGAFGGWLFRIARNELAQHYRRRREHVSLEVVADQPDGAVPVEAQAERSQELARVLAAVRTLSEREQDIVGLKFLGGLNNRQIGQAMGLKAGHVAVILYRAIRRLRGLLTQQGHG